MFGQTQRKNLHCLSQQKTKINSKCLCSFFYSILIFLGIVYTILFAIPNSIQATSFEIKDLHANRIGDYQESYALLIGVQDYTGYWSDLNNVPDDIDRIEKTLMQEHFQLSKLINPSGEVLKKSIQDFFQKKGQNTKDRVFLFFSGHGYTNKKNKKAYLIPTDAPNPISKTSQLLKTALCVSDIIRWAEKIPARHVLLMFDSCFSNSVFNRRAKTTLPNDISSVTLMPVKQFIVAGIDGNKLPQKSILVDAFVKAIAGQADLNDDQYVTATEFSIFANELIINSGYDQTPRYGRLNGMGDFVFQVSSTGQMEKEKIGDKFEAYLSVSANHPAEVYLNGWKIGKTPLEKFPVTPETYRLWVKQKEYLSYSIWLDVNYHQHYNLDVIMNRVKIPKSMIFIHTQPDDASVEVKNYPKNFYQGIPLETGSYEIEVKSRGYEPHYQRVDVNGNEDVYLDIRLDKMPEIAQEIENSIGMKFVLIYPDNYNMGSPDTEKERDNDEQLHRVTITRPFYLGQTEVTQSQWKKVMEDNPSFFWNCGSDCPVENVAYETCLLFIDKLNKLEETDTYRLPTEAEWEFSCRSGTQTSLSSGIMSVNAKGNSPELDEVAWYVNNNCIEYATRWPSSDYECISRGTHPVALKKANAWNLYDMHGNVYEWCMDIYHKDAYSKHAEKDPIYMDEGPGYVVRGGSWTHYPRLARSANRDYFLENKAANYIGLRLVKEP
ncbi:Sulphatase-modifying factor domain protein [Candidatus Magnetomorum sp. HK-1]|nr:Sulphatase-modifying factor domain protein [Candidatus Magnetomorum sp. HK-1]